MIKETIIKCDDEQTKAHNAWLEEKTVILGLLDSAIKSLPECALKMDLERVSNFIKRGEM